MADEAPFDLAAAGSVGAYVRSLPGTGSPLKTTIHPSDEMYRYERWKARGPEAAACLYFHIGHSTFQMVERIVRWRFGGFDGVHRFLDFASGYGRASRFLVRAIPPGRMDVAEIDPRAVRFQEETFGVRGMVSAPDPEDFRPDGPYDLVLACSFFSHLPAARFEAWLARLQRLLSPGGILIFSVHGMSLLPPHERGLLAGIVFRSTSETARLDAAEYGTSYVTPEFVRKVAESAAGDRDHLLAFPFGLHGFQDVYVLLRPPLPPVLDLRLGRLPWGDMENSAIQERVVAVEGWAMGESDERPPDVSLFLGDRLGGCLPGEGAYGSRRQWRFSFPTSAVDPDELIRVEAASPRGLSRIIVAGTLRPYLPRPNEG